MNLSTGRSRFLLPLVLCLPLSSCASSAAPVVAQAPEKPLVGVILPDRTSSNRWEKDDRPLLAQAIGLAGMRSDIQNGEGDETKFVSIAKEMVQRRVRLLVLTPPTTRSGAEASRIAKAAGIPTIDYDRLSLGGVSDYYVTTDSASVGQLQGQGLSECLAGKPGARVVEMEGSPSDNNAALVALGHKRSVGELYDNGTWTKVRTQSVDGWKADLATKLFEEILTSAGDRIDGVLAANDGIAGGVIDVLRRRGLAGKVQVTGQDATVESLRAILRGEQCMTVYKPIRDQAFATAYLAKAVVRNDLSGADDLATGSVRDSVTGRDVKSMLLGANIVTRKNVRTMVTGGVVTAQELCAGDIEPLCGQLDIALVK